MGHWAETRFVIFVCYTDSQLSQPCILGSSFSLPYLHCQMLYVKFPYTNHPQISVTCSKSLFVYHESPNTGALGGLIFWVALL